MEKVIDIDGRPVKFRATASVPRLYRIRFGRDIIQDMAQLRRDFINAEKSQSIPASATAEEKSELTQQAELSVLDLTMFENIAFIMARHGDPENTPDDVGKWLDGFETFSIYEVLPEIIELWDLNTVNTAISKNALGRQLAR